MPKFPVTFIGLKMLSDPITKPSRYAQQSAFICPLSHTGVGIPTVVSPLPGFLRTRYVSTRRCICFLLAFKLYHDSRWLKPPASLPSQHLSAEFPAFRLIL